MPLHEPREIHRQLHVAAAQRRRDGLDARRLERNLLQLLQQLVALRRRLVQRVSPVSTALDRGVKERHAVRQHLEQQPARDGSVELDRFPRVARRPRRVVLADRKRAVRRPRQRVHDVAHLRDRLQRYHVRGHHLVHAQLVQPRTGELRLVQERRAADLDVRVVDAVRVLIAHRLREEDGDHERDDELHRAGGLHDEKRDRHRHPRRAAEARGGADDRVRVQIDRQRAPRRRHRRVDGPSDDLPHRGADGERRDEQPGGRADAVGPRHQREHDEPIENQRVHVERVLTRVLRVAAELAHLAEVQQILERLRQRREEQLPVRGVLAVVAVQLSEKLRANRVLRVHAVLEPVVARGYLVRLLSQRRGHASTRRRGGEYEAQSRGDEADEHHLEVPPRAVLHGDPGLAPHRDLDVYVDEEGAGEAAEAADGGEYGHLPKVPPEYPRVVRLVVGVQPEIAVRPELGAREVPGVEVELVEPVRDKDARARREERAPHHAVGQKRRALLQREQHPADGRAERDGDARGGPDRNKVALIRVVAKARGLVRLKSERVRPERGQPAADEPAAVHERALLPRDETASDAERDPAQLRDDRPQLQEALQMHAVEVRLHLRDPAARGERFDVRHERAGDRG
mmetsp:Transcript_10385/g.37557  ORF Transcript_10385/g.37557 Transcript_10385/m.37557 type:complete len:629 (+) Transcript_10385:371-2257(+)